jgi:hypothetical protein
MSPAPRSPIPIVVGVLMIVLASIGLVATAVNLHGATSHRLIAASPSFAKLTVMITILDALVGLMHLTAGIAAVRYRRGAPERAITYAFARILLTMGSTLALVMFSRHELGSSTATSGLVVLAGLMTVWPVVVIALMTRPSARAACTI